MTGLRVLLFALAIVAACFSNAISAPVLPEVVPTPVPARVIASTSATITPTPMPTPSATPAVSPETHVTTPTPAPAIIEARVVSGDVCEPNAMITIEVRVTRNPDYLPPRSAAFNVLFPSDSLEFVSAQRGSGVLGEVSAEPVLTRPYPGPDLLDKSVRVAIADNSQNLDRFPAMATLTFRRTLHARAGYDVQLADSYYGEVLMATTGTVIYAEFDNSGLKDLCLTPVSDSDRDGLIDSREAELGTNANVRDSDHDGVEDGVEVALGSDPRDSGDPPAASDIDNDGVPDSLDTHPAEADADGDGYLDGYEIASGWSVESRASRPNLGDANLDGSAEFSDAVILFNVFLGNLDGADYADVRYLDVNRDGVVDSVDGVILINWYLGNIPYLPY